MGTPNKQNSLLVRSPKYSVFDLSSDSKLSMPLGKIVPVNCGYELLPGQEIDIRLQQLTRFLATLSPVMQRYVVDFIPVFVPYRLLWSEEAPIWNSNKFFNPATPDDQRPAIPMTSVKALLNNVGDKVFGSVFDYLGYPTLTALYEAMFETGRMYNAGTTTKYTLDEILNNSTLSLTPTISFDFTYLGTAFSIDGVSDGVKPFKSWLHSLANYTGTAWSSFTFEQIVPLIPGSHTLKSLQDGYVNYLFGECIKKVTSSSTSRDLSLLPFLCYHRAVSDWFVRTDLVDSDLYMSKLKSVTDYISNPSHITLKAVAAAYPTDVNIQSICSGDCANRMWMDDYFTTAMKSADAGQSVAIPVNGTMQQLWQANRLEEFRLKVHLQGKRFIDQVLGLFGVKIPDYRLQRSEILGHLKFNMVVSDILQTSQSDIDSKLGEIAGQAISSNGGHLLHYKALEPGMILILASVRPTTAYVDAVPRQILKKDYYDFLNPMFDNVGVQAIMNNEIFYRPGDTSVFGYTQRRYAEYMRGFNKISGEFKTSLDYWHAGRKFTSVPSLGTNFVNMTEADGLDRIFAAQGEANVLMQCYFDVRCSAPLSRFVNYHM